MPARPNQLEPKVFRGRSRAYVGFRTWGLGFRL